MSCKYNNCKLCGYKPECEICKENAELKDKLKNLSKVAEVRLANWQKYEKENAELKRQLEAEQKLNEQIKVRFVKCSSCTEEMKDKCLMFEENLCEGERCDELIDLVSLINESEVNHKLSKAKELLAFWVNDFYDKFNNSNKYEERHKALVETEQFLKESE